MDILFIGLVIAIPFGILIAFVRRRSKRPTAQPTTTERYRAWHCPNRE